MDSIHFCPSYHMEHPIQDLSTIKSANQALTYWLLHCFLYYHANQPLISDKDFDKLTGWLKQSWKFITHRHKDLITLEDLEAGTGFAIRYPLSVEMAAWQVLRDIAEPVTKKLVKKAPNPRVTANKPLPVYDSLFNS